MAHRAQRGLQVLRRPGEPLSYTCLTWPINFLPWLPFSCISGCWLNLPTSAVGHSHASALQSQESGGRVLSGKVASAQMLSKPEALEGKQVLLHVLSRQLSSCACRLLKPVHKAQRHSLAALHVCACTIDRCTQYSLGRASAQPTAAPEAAHVFCCRSLQLLPACDGLRHSSLVPMLPAGVGL